MILGERVYGCRELARDVRGVWEMGGKTTLRAPVKLPQDVIRYA